jgi:hypothetical protein
MPYSCVQSPQAAGPWDGVLDATRTAPKCIQRNIFIFEEEVSGEEDCLYLNVYTPQVSIRYLFIAFNFCRCSKVRLQVPCHTKQRRILVSTYSLTPWLYGKQAKRTNHFSSSNSSTSARTWFSEDHTEIWK